MEYEHVAGQKIRSELLPRDIADEANLLVDSQLAGHSSKARFLRAFSAHHQYSRSFPVKVVPHRAKHDVQAFLRSETLEGKEQRRTSRDVQGTSDGSAVTRRGRDLDAVVDNLTPRATAPVQRVPAVLRPIGDVADKRHQRPLPPPPQGWYPRTRRIAPIQGKNSRNPQPAFRHHTGQSRRHQIMNIHDIRMKPVDRAPNRRDSR